MKTHNLKLTDAQLRKLSMGQGITVKKAMLEGKGYDIKMSDAMHKKIEKMHSGGKCCILKMGKEELEGNGVEILEGGRINWSGIGRTLRKGAKAAANFYKDHVKDEVGPGLRRLVKKGVEQGLPAVADALVSLSGNPELVSMVDPVVRRLARRASEPVADFISKKTGAFGTKKKKHARKAVRKAVAPKRMQLETPLADLEKELLTSSVEMTPGGPVRPYNIQPPHPKFELQSNYWNFLGPNHPAFTPTLPSPDNSMACMMNQMAKHYGGKGLFYSKMGGAMLGSPMNPVVITEDNSGFHTGYL